MALITLPTDATLYITKNKAVTTLSAGIDGSQATVPVTDTGQFSSSGGFAVISESSTEEMIKYAGISGGDLTGVTRDYDSAGSSIFTSAAAIEEKIFAEHHNALKDQAKSLATSVRGLQSGSIGFSEFLFLQPDTGTGSVDTGMKIEADDSVGTVRLFFDYYNEDRSLEIGPNDATFTAMARFYGDHTAIDLAANRLRFYTGTNIGDAGELYCDINPTVGAASGAVAYDLRSKYDLVDSDSYIVRAQNQSTTLFGVRKAGVDVNQLHITGAGAHMFLTPLVADPTTPPDGTVWFKTTGGTTSLNIRVSGATKSVTLS